MDDSERWPEGFGEKLKELSMYIRPAKKDELVKWLADNGFIEEDLDRLAEALLDKFDLVGEFRTP